MNVGFGREKTVQLMSQFGIDVLVVYSPENVLYTTGMPTSCFSMGVLAPGHRRDFGGRGVCRRLHRKDRWTHTMLEGDNVAHHNRECNGQVFNERRSSNVGWVVNETVPSEPQVIY